MIPLEPIITWLTQRAVEAQKKKKKLPLALELQIPLGLEASRLRGFAFAPFAPTRSTVRTGSADMPYNMTVLGVRETGKI